MRTDIGVLFDIASVTIKPCRVKPKFSLFLVSQLTKKISTRNLVKLTLKRVNLKQVDCKWSIDEFFK